MLHCHHPQVGIMVAEIVFFRVLQVIALNKLHNLEK